MTSIELKKKAHTLIDALADNATLQEAVNFLKGLKDNSDWWDDISIEHKEAIETGLNDLKSGNIHSDEEVRSLVREKLLSQRNK